jgi:hypothetical protein
MEAVRSSETLVNICHIVRCDIPQDTTVRIANFAVWLLVTVHSTLTTSWATVLQKLLILVQVVKKFSASYGTQSHYLVLESLNTCGSPESV